MSIKPHVAQKYEVEFIECPYTADEFCKLIDRLQGHDVISWFNGDNDFELDRGELNNLLKSGNLTDDDELRKFINYLLSTADPNIDYIKIQLY